jgi:long-chain acyl-CoA synthetase
MLNITTFLDANSKRLDKDVLYNPTTGNKYNSGEILSIVSEIGRDLKELGIKDFVVVQNCLKLYFRVL